VNPSTALCEDQSSSASEKTDRRREARHPCNEPAEVRILSGDSEPLVGRVLDVSRSGLRLEIARALITDVAIQVVLPKEAIVFGRVRYCRPAGEGFHAGVYIDDVFYARSADGGNHLHDDDLALYLAKKGLTAVEILGVGDHLQRCRLCAARCYDALAV